MDPVPAYRTTGLQYAHQLGISNIWMFPAIIGISWNHSSWKEHVVNAKKKLSPDVNFILIKPNWFFSHIFRRFPSPSRGRFLELLQLWLRTATASGGQRVDFGVEDGDKKRVWEPMKASKKHWLSESLGLQMVSWKYFYILRSIITFHPFIVNLSISCFRIVSKENTMLKTNIFH